MKLNNKGFAITVVLYGLLILFVILISTYLIILSARKNRVDNLIKDIEKDYLNNITYNQHENNSNIREIYKVTLDCGGCFQDEDEKILYYADDINANYSLEEGEEYDEDTSEKEKKWYKDEDTTIEVSAISRVPIKTGNNNKFDGYYTKQAGSGGILIIDHEGNILNNSSVKKNIVDDTTLYAHWKAGDGSATE